MCELLCPAGSPKALQAAIDGGADAVYFGGLGFNARKNAQNFSAEEMKEAIALAHTYGVRVYITQNILVFDREMKDYLSAAESALSAGADALIVADIGGAAEIKRHFKDAVLHASTQLSGHNVAAAERLASFGFSRMVCAREMSAEDLKIFTENAPIEAEVFIHGALCVCHSGQCLFSSVVGGRSGNRGECAQPCRLPYAGSYPFSLKDLALAKHIPAIKELKVASLKIEGRMKSAEYVREVTGVYRRLLDENRAADDEEMRFLASVFSRGGFTDGYFTKNIGHKMLGIRSEADKDTSRALTPFRNISKKRPIEMSASLHSGKPISLTVTCESYTVSVKGEIAFKAQNAPLTEDTVAKSLTKLGSTPFSVASLSVSLDKDLMLPLSALNALRRNATDALQKMMTKVSPVTVCHTEPLLPKNKKIRQKSAVFRTPSQIPPQAKDFFDLIYLALEAYDGSVSGIALPPVIFDSDKPLVISMLQKAVALGARHALIGNVGHLDLALTHGLIPHGDFRLNIANNASAATIESLGFKDFVLSPELSLPKIRDIGGAASAVVYGRLPLMLLEKCVGKEIGSCRSCQNGQIRLKDRRGVSFPVLREWKHRSVVYNSLPTALPDRMHELYSAGIRGEHFIFSTETQEECASVIKAFQKGTALPFETRRLPKSY